MVDLDNTLWDWFSVWAKSFRVLVAAPTKQTGIPMHEPEREIRRTHEACGTSEYPWLIDELDLRSGPALSNRVRFESAVEAQNSVPRDGFPLHPAVERTLRKVREFGIPIVGYTESLLYWTQIRLRPLDGIADYVYSSSDHDEPSGPGRFARNRSVADPYTHQHTLFRHVPSGVLMSSSEVIRGLSVEFSTQVDKVVYVDDSLMKDVAMANAAGASAVHARYGNTDKYSDDYALLQRVPHWPEQDVRKEDNDQPLREASPDFTIDSLADLLKVVDFEMCGSPFRGKSKVSVVDESGLCTHSYPKPGR